MDNLISNETVERAKNEHEKWVPHSPHEAMARTILAGIEQGLELSQIKRELQTALYMLECERQTNIALMNQVIEAERQRDIWNKLYTDEIHRVKY